MAEFSDEAKNAQVDSTGYLLDGGQLQILDAKGAILGAIRFADEAFTRAVNGEAEAHRMPIATATGDGKAARYACVKETGGLVVRGTIGKKNSELTLNTLDIVKGGELSVSRFVLRV